MGKAQVFARLVLRSLVLGLIGGTGLSLIIGLLCALMLGPIALGLALGIGVAAGAALGLLNGLLIGAITSLWFAPLRDERRYHQVLGWCCVLGNVIGLSVCHQYFLAVFAGPVAWCASQYVGDWYQALSEQGLDDRA